MNDDHANRSGATRPPGSARDPGHPRIREDSSNGSLAVAPSLGVSLDRVLMPRCASSADSRILTISIYAIVIGVAAAYIAQALVALIGLVTNLAFYGRWSTAFVSPAIRGHGIPEAMEQILRNDSKIPARMTFLKPLSSAIAIGTGGPFGAEGPIIATGGALGSLLGQVVHVTANERKVLLAAGAAAGMAAIFAGASRALLTSIVFAFETARQFAGLLPLLGGCTAAYFVSVLTMRTTIMTEKIVRRGVRVPDEFSADFLAQMQVAEVCTRTVRTLRDTATVGEIRAWFAGDDPGNQHQGYPVIDAEGRLRGVITRRQIQSARYADSVAIADAPPHTMVGIITRGDLLAAHAKRLRETHHAETHIRLRQR